VAPGMLFEYVRLGRAKELAEAAARAGERVLVG
jgi:hypothetical protein